MNATVAYEWLVAQDDAERKLQGISPFIYLEMDAVYTLNLGYITKNEE